MDGPCCQLYKKLTAFSPDRCKSGKNAFYSSVKINLTILSLYSYYHPTNKSNPTTGQQSAVMDGFFKVECN